MLNYEVMTQFAHLLFWLVVAHALCDFSLQTDAMAKGKNHNTPTTPPPGQIPNTVWPYWLTAHSLIHGGAVALITGSIMLGAIETVLHWLIDRAKCCNKTNIHTDQAMHLLCKVLWAAVVTFGG